MSQANIFLPGKEEGLNGRMYNVGVCAEHPGKRAHCCYHFGAPDPDELYERVVPLLREAVGEWAMDAVLVVELTPLPMPPGAPC